MKTTVVENELEPDATPSDRAGTSNPWGLSHWRSRHSGLHGAPPFAHPMPECAANGGDPGRRCPCTLRGERCCAHADVEGGYCAPCCARCPPVGDT